MAADSPDPATPPPSGAMHHAMRFGRRVGIAIAGSAVIGAGVVMIVAPGPAFLVIPLGLGILSLEFERPRVWLAWVKARGVRLRDDAQHRLQARRAARQRRDGKTDIP